ncbi:MAG: hypothetical protein FIB01_01865 [Gemmatimonadetes bacterium]|nr:hypothetical protein [Gemmatimonadota bacterium]
MKQIIVTVAAAMAGALAVLLVTREFLAVTIPTWFVILVCGAAALTALGCECWRARARTRFEESSRGMVFDHSLDSLRAKVGKHAVALGDALQRFQERYGVVAQLDGLPEQWVARLQGVEIPTLYAADQLGTDFAGRIYSAGGKTSAEGFYQRLPGAWQGVVSLDEFARFHEHRAQLIQLANQWAHAWSKDRNRYARLVEVFAEPATAALIAQLTYLEVALAERLGSHDPVSYQVPWFKLFYKACRKRRPAAGRPAS